jgi:hypothetical protein
MQSNDSVFASPLTGDNVAHFVTGGSLTKVTSCTFHATLPWIALTPKHGEIISVWDFNTHTLVGQVDILSLLGAQLSSVIPGGEWTADLCGHPSQVFFLDRPQLRWHHELNRSQRYDPAAPISLAAAGPTPLPSPRNAPGNLMRQQLTLGDANASATFSTSLVANLAGGGASAEGAAHSASHDSMRLAIVTSNMATIVDAATSTITPIQIQNRGITCARLVVVETAARYGYTYDGIHGTGGGMIATMPAGLTPNMLDDVTAEVVLGCNDGAILIWTITPAPQNISQLASDSRVPARADILRVIKTPHASSIVTLSQFAFVNTTSYKSRLPDDPQMGDGEDDDEAAESRVLLFQTRQRTSFVSLVYGSKGGSVGHIAICGAPDSFVQMAQAEAVANGLSPQIPTTGSSNAQSVLLFAKKNVHDQLLSTAVSLVPPSLLYSASPKNHVSDTTTVDALVLSFLGLKHIYALGPNAVTLHQARTGIELRRLPLPSQVIPSPPVSIAVNYFSAFLFCAGDDHFSLSLDVTQESLRHCLRLSDLIPITSGKAREERTLRSGPYGTQSAAPSLGRNDDHDPAYTPSDANVRVYGAVLDPANSAAQVAVLTNEGCIVVEAQAASTTLSVPGVFQSQQIFGLPPPSDSPGFDIAPASGSAVGSSRRRSAANRIQQATKSPPPSSSSTVSFLVRGHKSRISVVTAIDALDGDTGVTNECRPPRTPHYLLRAMHELAVGIRDGGAEALPPNANSLGLTATLSKTILEPSPTFSVRSVHVTARADLVAVVTDTQELLVFELSGNGASTPLIVPPALKQAHPDTVAWSITSSFIALLNLETQSITVGSLESRTGRYGFLPQPHVIPTSNAPRGISGGRWLCVHFEPTFSGVTSQFYRWESSSRGGGGALGGFIPQPKMLEWDLTATLCALIYDSNITFMQAVRKTFSVLCTTDVRSVPLHVRFVRRALFMVLHREVVMLLPTAQGVHKIVVASSSTLDVHNKATSTHGARKLRNRGVERSGGGTFDAVVYLRPLGHLTISNFDEVNFELYLADETCKICRVPLAGTIAHLLWTLHSAPSVATVATATGTTNRAATQAAKLPSEITGTAPAGCWSKQWSHSLEHAAALSCSLTAKARIHFRVRHCRQLAQGPTTRNQKIMIAWRHRP